MFKIVGYYEGNGEIVDEADTLRDAQQLAAEYRMAFGPGWVIDVVME